MARVQMLPEPSTESVGAVPATPGAGTAHAVLQLFLLGIVPLSFGGGDADVWCGAPDWVDAVFANKLMSPVGHAGRPRAGAGLL